jgi:hypothetical protein
MRAAYPSQIHFRRSEAAPDRPSAIPRRQLAGSGYNNFGLELRAFLSRSSSDANKWRGQARSGRGGTRPRVSVKQPLSRRPLVLH